MDKKTDSSNSGMSWGLASLVFGITAVVFSIIPCVGFLALILDLPAIIFAVISLSKAKENNSPKSLAIAGLILGIIAAIFIMINMFLLLGFTVLGSWD
jgi:hypothetical protein